jgi:hypothetical protein
VKARDYTSVYRVEPPNTGSLYGKVMYPAKHQLAVRAIDHRKIPWVYRHAHP